MATPQLSPGLLIREVDLTVGRAENILDTTGAIAGPFGFGPVDEITRITTEQELLDTFGSPFSMAVFLKLSELTTLTLRTQQQVLAQLLPLQLQKLRTRITTKNHTFMLLHGILQVKHLVNI